MPSKTTKKRVWRWLRRGVAALLLIVLILAVTVWLMFQHKPGWYRPVVLDEAGRDQARTRATGTVDEISDLIVQGEPFDFALHDLTVNEWLAGMDALWPEARAAIPPELADLATRFDDDVVRIGALCTGEGAKVILNAAFSARVSKDGRNIEIALVGVGGGSLPLPRSALDKMLTPLLSEGGDYEPFETDSELESALRNLRSVDDLFEGIELQNRFVWPNGDRPFRIDSIKIDNGQLCFRIEPL